LEAVELEAVLTELGGRDPVTCRMAAISAYAGLRLNEVLQLCPSRISLFNGTFRVRRKASTGQSVESIVHFPKHLAPILQDMLDEKTWGPDEKFFKSLNRTSYQRALAASRINEGRSPQDRATWVCFHSLRHTFASLACSNGVDIPTLSHMLGHKSLATTAIYLKTSEKQINGAIAKMEAAHKF
jgi:integrase